MTALAAGRTRHKAACLSSKVRRCSAVPGFGDGLEDVGEDREDRIRNGGVNVNRLDGSASGWGRRGGVAGSARVWMGMAVYQLVNRHLEQSRQAREGVVLRAGSAAAVFNLADRGGIDPDQLCHFVGVPAARPAQVYESLSQGDPAGIAVSSGLAPAFRCRMFHHNRRL